VEAHCCGMKGLGGATVEVLCHPDQIAPGKDFTVNVRYRSDVPRPVDVHVDVLNAQNKAFYAGKWAEMDDMAGDVSLTIKMADQAEEPFLWKVGVTTTTTTTTTTHTREEMRMQYSSKWNPMCRIFRAWPHNNDNDLPYNRHRVCFCLVIIRSL